MSKKERKLKCTTCGDEFIAKNTQAKYCPVCKIKVAKERVKAYALLHPELRKSRWGKMTREEKDRQNERKKEKYRTDPEERRKRLEYKRQYNKDNREKINAYWRKMYHKPDSKLRQRKTNAKKFVQIGTLIKDLVMGTPTYGTKSLWDGVGRWAIKYDFCVECNSNMYLHRGNGLCVKCDWIAKKDNMSEEDKEKRRKKMRERREIESVQRLRRLKDAKKFIEKVQTKEVEETPKIHNLMIHLADTGITPEQVREEIIRLEALEKTINLNSGRELEDDEWDWNETLK